MVVKKTRSQVAILACMILEKVFPKGFLAYFLKRHLSQLFLDSYR